MKIDITPDVPRPRDEVRVTAAMDDAMKIAENLPPRFSYPQHILLCPLLELGHTFPVAKWALFELVQGGGLVVSIKTKKQVMEDAGEFIGYDPMTGARWNAEGKLLSGLIDPVELPPNQPVDWEHLLFSPRIEVVYRIVCSRNDDPATQWKIPAKYRTRAMTRKEAARLLGFKGRKAVDQLRKAIKDETVACESLGRESHVFDLRDFPESVHPVLMVEHPTTKTAPTCP